MTLTNFLQNIINVLPQAAGFYPTTQDRSATISARGRHFRRFTRAIIPLLLFYAVVLEYVQELLPRTQEYRNNGMPPSYFTTMVQLFPVIQFSPALSTSIPLVVGRSYTIYSSKRRQQQRRNGIETCGDRVGYPLPTRFSLAVGTGIVVPSTTSFTSCRNIYYSYVPPIVTTTAVKTFEEDITARVIQY